MCAACHEDISKGLAKNAHRAIDTNKKAAWEGKTCEACHGPAQKHAESADPTLILHSFKKGGATDDAACLACHKNQPTHFGRILGSHARNAVGCTSCHAMHSGDTGGRAAIKPATLNEKCQSCHVTTRNEFERPHAHPLPRGAMSCLDCHNPHGASVQRSLKTMSGNEAVCNRCHGDKRGPFAFEHAPLRMEGCSACHEPHGSVNPKLLTRQEVRFVCLECHSNTSSIVRAPGGGTIGGPATASHDLRNPRYQNCTICHVKIHGSQVNRAFLR